MKHGHLATAGFAALLAAGVLAAASSQEAPPFSGDEDVAYAETLWSALLEAGLAGDNAANTVPPMRAWSRTAWCWRRSTAT